MQVVGVKGLEPLCPKAADFKSAASANSATPPKKCAHVCYHIEEKIKQQMPYCRYKFNQLPNKCRKFAIYVCCVATIAHCENVLQI